MEPNPPYPGDDIIHDAAMIYDRQRTIQATAADIFPWLQQLGKGRAGWYVTSKWEVLLPSSWLPSRRIESQWQNLQVGDRVDDYGSKDDHFIVMAVDAPNSLIYKSERLGTVFTWALLLHETQPSKDSDVVQTIVHLRFRGRLASTGLKRWLLIRVGDFMDHITTAPMLAGLAERVEGKRAA